MDSWHMVLLEPARLILADIGQFLVSILLVLVILGFGWTISKLIIRPMIVKVLKAIKIIDIISDKLGIDRILAKGGIRKSLPEIFGELGYWLALLITFVVAVNAIGLTLAADLLKNIILYIPNVVLAIFILIVGIFVATLLKNIVQTAANNTGVAQANLLAKIAELVVIIFTIFVTIEQLNIGIRISEITLSIILGSIGLALALAFGLGCRDVAAQFVEDLIKKMKK